MPPTQKTDDYDMARLQKSLKQRQRHSIQARPHVAKLTPAEIRSLNNSAAASKVASIASSKSTSEHSHRRLSNATPPATPDHPTAYQAQVSRASTISLPTPPHSPNPQHRRASQSSVNNYHHSYHGHIHHPRPRGSKQAEFMIANGLHSRPSSASTTSSIRSVPMYRGHEVTRTGSLTAFQRPPQEIVTNPLSMFSRPRQATVNPAPDSRREFLEMDAYQAQAMLDADDEERSPDDENRQSSPSVRTDSPVSIHGHQHSATAGPTHLAKQVSNSYDDPKEEVLAVPTASVSQQTEAAPSTTPVGLVQSDTEAVPKKAPKKRFTFHSGSLDKKGKDPAVLTRKSRRKTVAFTKSTDELAKPTTDSLSDEREASPPESFSDEIPAHPAVRPLSPVSQRKRSSPNPSIASALAEDNKDTGKSLAPLIVPKGPVYGRCACCGKIRRPSGYHAELSPVMENENLRTNFSLEMDRARVHRGADSDSMASTQRYTPIIPMALVEPGEDGKEGSIRTVQASIEPQMEEFKPRNKRLSEPHKIVRFASLHALRGDGELDDEEVVEDLEVQSVPVVDPTIKPKSSIALRPMIAESEQESVASTQNISARPQSVASTDSTTFEMARPQSIRTVKATPVGASRPPSMSTVKAPSEGSGRTSSTGPRSSVIGQWYENAVREGPKQDVISVVGWDSKGRRMSSEPTNNGRAVESPRVTEESQRRVQAPAMNGHEVSPTVSPTKEKENKRRSILPGGFLKKLVQSSKPDTDTQTPTDSAPSSAVEFRPQPTTFQSTDSAVSMTGANPSAFTASPTSFTQPSPIQNKKGHAPKLSLGLEGDDMNLGNLGLPTPHLGPHFARSNVTLKGLVSSERTPELEKELEVAMERPAKEVRVV